MRNLRFDFSVDNTGEIEYTSPYNDSTKIECDEVLQKLLNRDLIELGERSEGFINIERGKIKLDYRVCNEVGEDWDSDVWEDVEEEYPISVIE